MSVKILYSSAFVLASWPGEHVIQAVQLPCRAELRDRKSSFVMRWECDGEPVESASYVNINDCIRAAVRLELVAKERN